MKLEIILIIVGVILGIVAFLSSKFLRTISRESLMRPNQSCEIKVAGKDVLVNRIKTKDNSED